MPTVDEVEATARKSKAMYLLQQHVGLTDKEADIVTARWVGLGLDPIAALSNRARLIALRRLKLGGRVINEDGTWSTWLDRLTKQEGSSSATETAARWMQFTAAKEASDFERKQVPYNVNEPSRAKP